MAFNDLLIHTFKAYTIDNSTRDIYNNPVPKKTAVSGMESVKCRIDVHRKQKTSGRFRDETDLIENMEATLYVTGSWNPQNSNYLIQFFHDYTNYPSDFTYFLIRDLQIFYGSTNTSVHHYELIITPYTQNISDS